MSLKRYVLITGASSGIGESLCEEFAKHGHHIIAVARTVEKLQKLSERLSKTYRIEVVPFACDLLRAIDRKKLYAAVSEQNLHLETLVLNAGIGHFGYVGETSFIPVHDLLQLNIVATVELAHFLLPHLLKFPPSNILVVGSIAGFQPGPMMAAYYASKSFINHWAQALHEELRGKSVHVSVLCPGPTQSEFHAKAQMKTSVFYSLGAMTSKKVAQIGYDGLKAKKRMIICGTKNKILSILSKITPQAILLTLLHRSQKRRAL